MLTTMPNNPTHRGDNLIMKSADIFFRLIGVFLGGSGLLGAIWFFNSSPMISVVLPLCLLLISVTRTEIVVRYWIVLLAGFVLCTIDIVLRGLPFFRNYEEFDVEFLYALQMILFAYFGIRSLIYEDDNLLSHLKNLLP